MAKLRRSLIHRRYVKWNILALSRLIRLGSRKLFYGQLRGLEAYPEGRFYVSPFRPLCPYHKSRKVSLKVPVFLGILEPSYLTQ